MYILHLSDLHFGTIQNAENWYSQIADDLKISLKCHCLDALVISGDIANKSTPKEYEAAELFVKSICNEFKLKPEQVILVPGNHDLNWSLAKKAHKQRVLKDEEEYKKYFDENGKPNENEVIDRGDFLEVKNERKYKKRFLRFSKFYEAIKGKPYPEEYDKQSILYFLPEKNLLFLGLNSAWQLDHFYKSRASIHSNALSSVLTKLRLNSKLYEKSLKFAVWHHPLISSSEDRIKDVGFLERLCLSGFFIGLHGHIHKSDANDFRYDIGKGGRKLHMICAGTFGAPTYDWVPGYPLQYNLLEIKNNSITVNTRKRIEINGTWKPDAMWSQGPDSDPLPRYDIPLPKTSSSRLYQNKSINELPDKEIDDKKFNWNQKSLYEEMDGLDKPNQRMKSSTVKKLLILAVNPKSMDFLRIDKEVREICSVLRNTKKVRYIVEVRWAVRIRNLQSALLDFEPDIIHFCGHSKNDGIILEDDFGLPMLISPTALSKLFSLFAGQFECILFNSCYTSEQGNAILPHVGAMIITDYEIQDKDAIVFSIGFYQALSHGKSIEIAYNFGCESIRMQRLREGSTPILIKNPNFVRQKNNITYEEHQKSKGDAIKILFVAVNPQDTARLNLDEEIHQIYEVLERPRSNGKIIIEQLWAARFGDFQQSLLDFKPNIIHFSGFGERNIGLLFEDNAGFSRIIRTLQLVRLFKMFSYHLECVLLNASDTEQIAFGISKYINYSIGMPLLADKAARAFSEGFYRALGANCTYEECFQLGCVEIESHLETCFKLTKRSLNYLKDEGMNEKTLKDLKSLIDQEFLSEEELKNKLSELGDDTQFNSHKELIWKYVEHDVKFDLRPKLYKKLPK